MNILLPLMIEWNDKKSQPYTLECYSLKTATEVVMLIMNVRFLFDQIFGRWNVDCMSKMNGKNGIIILIMCLISIEIVSLYKNRPNPKSSELLQQTHRWKSVFCIVNPVQSHNAFCTMSEHVKGLFCGCAYFIWMIVNVIVFEWR